MGLVSLALRGAVRNGRRSLSAILGTMLVVGVVVGENIAVDSTARGLWEAVESEVSHHFTGQGWLNNTTESEPIQRSVSPVP
jgi:hypothetical protein